MSTSAPPRTGLQAVGLIDGTAIAVDPAGRLLAIQMQGGQSPPRAVVLARRVRHHDNGSTTFVVSCPACAGTHQHGDEGEPLGWRQADCPGGPSYFVVTRNLFRPIPEEIHP